MLSITKTAPSAIRHNSNLHTVKSNIKNTQAVSFKGEANVSNEISPVPEDKIFGENHVLNPIIKQWLDERKYVFDTKEGPRLLSIKDMIAQSEHMEMPNLEMTAYRGCFIVDEIDDIKNHGLDPSRIIRTKFGPGFYFTSAEGEAREYGSAVLKAKVQGKCWYMHEPKWYDKLTSSSSPVYNSLSKYIGMQNFEITKGILDEYVRNLMYNELGADFAICAGNIICFDPESVTSIESM